MLTNTKMSLTEFCHYLVTLVKTDDRQYTFEMADETMRLRECSFDKVLRCCQDLENRNTGSITIVILCRDYRNGTLNSCSRTFTRTEQ
jgi:hypothetical protein